MPNRRGNPAAHQDDLIWAAPWGAGKRGGAGVPNGGRRTVITGTFALPALQQSLDRSRMRSPRLHIFSLSHKPRPAPQYHKIQRCHGQVL